MKEQIRWALEDIFDGFINLLVVCAGMAVFLIPLMLLMLGAAGWIAVVTAIPAFLLVCYWIGNGS